MTRSLRGAFADLRHNTRHLLRNRAFTLPAVAGLALSIGAATAVFSVVHTMLLRSMGFQRTDRLAAIWQTDLKRGQKHVEVCWADLEEWRKQTDIIEEVALASSVNLDFPITGDGPPQQVDGTTVTGNFFRLLGAQLEAHLFGISPLDPASYFAAALALTFVAAGACAAPALRAALVDPARALQHD